MNSNQRSQGNNQSNNGANEKSGSRSRGSTADKGNLNQSQQSGKQSGSRQGASEQDAQIDRDSVSRSGSQTGSEQQGQQGQRQSNDLAGGLPRSPGTKNLSADEDMDDDTGLSNRGNRQSSDDIDEGTRQERQSNVGRRSDGTPD